MLLFLTGCTFQCIGLRNFISHFRKSFWASNNNLSERFCRSVVVDLSSAVSVFNFIISSFSSSNWQSLEDFHFANDLIFWLWKKRFLVDLTESNSSRVISKSWACKPCVHMWWLAYKSRDPHVILDVSLSNSTFRVKIFNRKV